LAVAAFQGSIKRGELKIELSRVEVPEVG
jgi:hypothetical protein